MFSFIPALLLLLLNGPSSMDRSAASVFAEHRLTASQAAIVRRHQAWLNELLNSGQADALLAVLGFQATETQETVGPSVPQVMRFDGNVKVAFQPAAANRNRDGPLSA